MISLLRMAQHRVINAERSKNVDSALAARKKGRQGAGKRARSQRSGAKCDNCGGLDIPQLDCWSKGGGKKVRVRAEGNLSKEKENQ